MPHVIQAKANETLYICQCGKTQNAPFCDGSHEGSGDEPLAYTATVDGPIYVCGCGKTLNKPWCDGSHDN
ncbi:CDGSH iron-sulfur domain-containing protein 3 [Gammaproteobacteria bacterium]